VAVAKKGWLSKLINYIKGAGGPVRSLKSGKQWGVGIFAALMIELGVEPNNMWFIIMAGLCQFGVIVGGAIEDAAKKKAAGG